MSRQTQENKNICWKLIGKFNKEGYPAEYPWIMEFLYKVQLEGGRVNTANQQDTLNKLWEKYGR